MFTKHQGLTFSLVAAAAFAAGCQPSDEELAARYEGVVRTYCLECHDAAGREAGLSLEGVDLDAIADAHGHVRERRAQAARPADAALGGPRPDAETYRRVRGVSRAAPRRGRARERRSPGQASIHRLNRTEYGNAVRDLLALEVDAAEFLPADDEGYGFDNIADVLRVSPSLLEQYLVGVGEDRGARGRRSRTHRP